MLKRSLLTVLIVVSSSPLVAIAAQDSFAGAPTPVQAYHSDAPPAPAQSDATAMAEVQAVMAKAKQDAAKNTPDPVSKPLAPQISQKPSHEKSPGANAENTDLAGQLATLSQTNLMFQQRADQQIEALSSKNEQLTEQLAKMGQALSLLNQEVISLNSKLQANESGKSTVSSGAETSSWAELKPELLNGTSYLLYAVLAALLVIILLMLPWYRRQQKSPAPVMAAQEPNEGEYDFMGTHEAIPAKLDLARAYLAMEDHEAAAQVLAEIQKNGNAEQRAEANKMLGSIPRKS